MENKASVTETSVDEESVVNTIPSEPKRKIEWNTIIAGISVLSVILSGVASFIQYWWDALYLRFWHISTDFIHTSERSFIYYLALLIGLTVIFFFISWGANRAYKLILHKSHNKKKARWFWIFVGFINILLFYFLFSILIWIDSDTLSFSFAWVIDIANMANFILVIIFGIIFAWLMFYVGHIFSTTGLTKNERKNFLYKHIVSTIGIVVTLTVLLGGSYILIYRFQSCKNTTTFDIIDNQYVVLYKDTDTFVVKECCIHRDGENDKIYINTDAYRLIDAKDIEVQTIHLSSEDKQVFDLCTAEEYAEHLASESPAHETSG